MTENDWMTCADPDALLASVRGRVSPRQLRLFACACCRRIPAVLVDDQLARAVGVIERCADGLADRRDRERARADAEAVEASASGQLRAAARAVAASWSTAEHAASAAACASPSPQRERACQADLLRDVVGNPFKPMPVETTWLEGTGGLVTHIARAVYEEGRYADLPILADALEEVGCTQEALLAHCRSGAGHVRGCWALDTLLGVPVVGDVPETGVVVKAVEPVEVQGRYVRQGSCPGHFAVVHLRVEPFAGPAQAVFLNAAQPDPEAQVYVPAVEEGIRLFLGEQAKRGRRVSGVRVVLTRLIRHPVDSRARSFERAASLALAQAFGETGGPSAT
jgi:hypothetical protein